MEQSEESRAKALNLGCVFAAILMVAGIRFFISAGWSEHPSNQQLAALGCAVLGAISAFIMFEAKMADEHDTKYADDPIKNQSIESQKKHWKKKILKLFIVATIVSVIYAFFPTKLIFAAAQGLWLTWFINGMDIVRCLRELSKLPNN